MKRSKINKTIKDMEILVKRYGFTLPPFCRWTTEEWKEKSTEKYDEIRDNMLGWDVTDFGMNDFEKIGFTLITLRNGNTLNYKYKKTYAEKLLMLYEGQSAPMHFHWNKMEDIINRGGNDVFITVFNSDKEGNKLDTDVVVSLDGVENTLSAGSKIKLSPGESITINPYLYHDFTVPKSGGSVLLGEVSMCNDDNNDNRFLNPIGRFPEIIEDEEPYRFLCNEYPK
ncbi:MAG: D-lyxose/D-mannose family sugar isomerase [Lachnospiraceae bacterium]